MCGTVLYERGASRANQCNNKQAAYIETDDDGILDWAFSVGILIQVKFYQADISYLLFLVTCLKSSCGGNTG